MNFEMSETTNDGIDIEQGLVFLDNDGDLNIVVDGPHGELMTVCISTGGDPFVHCEDEEAIRRNLDRVVPTGTKITITV